MTLKAPLALIILGIAGGMFVGEIHGRHAQQRKDGMDKPHDCYIQVVPETRPEILPAPTPETKLVGKWQRVAGFVPDFIEWSWINAETGAQCGDIFKLRDVSMWSVCNGDGSCLPDNINLDKAKQAIEAFPDDRKLCSEEVR
jgi:hypothetical protein